MNEFEKDMIDKIEKNIVNNNLGNDFLVSNLKLCEQYLSLKRISQVSNNTGKSTQGLRKSKKHRIIKFCGLQLIIDNK